MLSQGMCFFFFCSLRFYDERHNFTDLYRNKYVERHVQPLSEKPFFLFNFAWFVAATY